MNNRSTPKRLTDYFNKQNATVESAEPSKSKKPAVCKKRSRGAKDTPALVKFFAVRPEKRHRVMHGIKEQQQHTTKATIGVAYRHDKDGIGALFDHQTLQLATDYPTAVMNTDVISKGFDKAIRALPAFLKYGLKPDRTDFVFPPLLNANDASLGLLVIPGVSADSYKSPEYKVRRQAETDIINAAIKRGQPVLGICGGSWVLYQAYGGQIISVEGHNYRGGMPRLGKNDGLPSNNKQVHRLALNPETTLLRAGLGITLENREQMTVNSVHGYAPSDINIPQQILISATALPDEKLASSNAAPSENSIEAFETKHGTPVMGIQWHPEAYANNTEHAKLLRYMTLAGQRYVNHRKVQAELLQNFNTIKSRLKHQNKLSYQNGTIRRETNHQVSFDVFKLKKTSDLRHIDEAAHEIQVKETYYIHHAYTIKKSTTPTASTRQNEQPQERHGLFSNSKKDNAQKQTVFNDNMPTEFKLGISKDKGDCFFDSCAQQLNELYGTHQYTDKMLRELCRDYAIALDKKCEQNPQHNDNWLAKLFRNQGDYYNYLMNIQYTDAECQAGIGSAEGYAIWGEQHIDGRIICEVLGIKLHIVQVMPNPDDKTSNQAKFLVGHKLFDEKLKAVELNKDNKIWSDAKTIRIAVCDNHFVPISKN